MPILKQSYHIQQGSYFNYCHIDQAVDVMLATDINHYANIRIGRGSFIIMNDGALKLGGKRYGLIILIWIAMTVITK